MEKEDYFEYYVKGSEVYMLPKDIFNELFDEMENWKEECKKIKEKYLNAVSDYEQEKAKNKRVKECIEQNVICMKKGNILVQLNIDEILKGENKDE